MEVVNFLLDQRITSLVPTSELIHTRDENLGPE